MSLCHTGALLFKDYWSRDGDSEENRSGDHIDLWNKDKTTGYWVSWSRGFDEFFGFVSDQNDSKAVWFWEVK